MTLFLGGSSGSPLMLSLLREREGLEEREGREVLWREEEEAVMGLVDARIEVPTPGIACVLCGADVEVPVGGVGSWGSDVEGWQVSMGDSGPTGSSSAAVHVFLIT